MAKTAPFALYCDITNTQERRFVHLEPAAQARNPSIRLKDHSAHIFHALHEFVRSQIGHFTGEIFPAPAVHFACATVSKLNENLNKCMIASDDVY